MIVATIKDVLQYDLAALDLQIITCEGCTVEDFKSAIQHFAIDLSDDKAIVSRVGLIRDADINAERAFSELCSVLNDLSLPVPVEPLSFTDAAIITGILIIGTNRGTGKIEDVCLTSVADDPAFECINGYFECIEGLVERGELIKPKNLSKARAAVYLASRERYKSRVGYGVDHNYWDLAHGVFEPLRTFLTGFLS